MKVFTLKKVNFISIKYNIFLWTMLMCPFLQAQIAFEGEPVSMSVLNSAADENFIFVNSDGSEIAFTRLKSPNNTGGISNPGNIWISVFDSVWSPPRLVEGDSQKLQSPMGYSQGLIYGEVTEKYNAYTSEVFDSRGRTISIPYFQNKSQNISGFLSRDGSQLLLSIERSTTYGVEDIYLCIKDNNGGWSTPKNLGSDINTPFQEYTPFLSANGTTLYWASNGRSGIGSFDIYQSERLDDTWQNWSEPKNLGQSINTEGAETSFQLAGDYAYFVSTQNSDGYGDIRRIKLKVPEQVVEEPREEVVEEELLAIVQFYLNDAETGNPVVGTVMINGISIDSIFTNMSSLSIARDRLGDFKITVDATGYLGIEKFFTQSESAARSNYKLELIPLAIGTTVQLNNVLFQRGTINFVGGSENELDRVVELLQSNPNLKILVKGHTDNQGDPSRNLRLSQQRAKKVRDYILSKKIPSSRVQGKGYGGNAPIAENNTEASRKLNRRVEFTVIEK